MSDVFISYSRKDKEFVKALHEALIERNRDTWVDWEDIPLTADWWQEIQLGIEDANAFVFILTPDSVASKVCREEIDHAVKNNKRLIPVVHREGFEMNLVHEALSRHNWLFFREQDDFAQTFGLLLSALDTDLDYVRAHTRLLQRAIEWNKKQRNDSYLLRGSDLAEAEQWLIHALKAPEPTVLQKEYINASQHAEVQRQKAEIKRQRIALVGVTAGLVVTTGLAIATFREATLATLREQAAEAKNLLSAQPVQGLVLAVQATGLNRVRQLFTGKVLDSVQTGLLSAIELTRERTVMTGHTDSVTSVALSTNGELVASGSEDNTIRLWNRQGQVIGTAFQGHTAAVTAVAFSPDSQRLVSSSEDGTVRLWDLKGQPIGSPFKGHTGAVTAVAFSPDGQYIASSGEDQTIRLWNQKGASVGQLFRGHTGAVTAVAFSPDGQFLVSGSEDQTLRLWNLRGQPIGKPFQGHKQAVTAVAFSPDGQLIASGGKDRSVRLWNLRGQPQGDAFRGQADTVTSVAFSPDGQTIISGGQDNAIRLWNRQGQVMDEPLRGHTAWVRSVIFSPDGQTIISGANDNTVRLWNRNR